LSKLDVNEVEKLLTLNQNASGLVEHQSEEAEAVEEKP